MTNDTVTAVPDEISGETEERRVATKRLSILLSILVPDFKLPPALEAALHE